MTGITERLSAITKSTAEQQYVPYVRPQENGHKTETRWLALTDKTGEGLLFIADSNFMGLTFPATGLKISTGKNQSPVPMAKLHAKGESHDPLMAKNRKPKQTHVNDIFPRNFIGSMLESPHDGCCRGR